MPRVDDRWVISGIIFVIRNGLRWRDAPREYGPNKTIYNRFIRWSRMEVFAHSGIKLIKYYLDISKDEQRKRLKARKEDPLKR